MAEKNFKDALEIIKSNINQDKAVMQQADQLLDVAIENALIIEEDFFETKYLDDAYFILGMSSFYKNRMTASKFYFNRIINEFSTSDKQYINKTKIWLAFIDLKTNNFDMLTTKINEIDLSLLAMDELFLYHLLLAEFFLYKEDYIKVEKQYIESLKHTSNRVDKLYIYNKLLQISEIQEKYSNSVEYIDNIKNYSENNQLTDEMFDKWIDYNIKINNMKIVLEKLDELITITPSKKKNIDYKITQINIYMKMNDYNKCKDMLDLLISENIENNVFKKEMAHFYYLFAEIMLNENNYSEAQRYYDLSVNASVTSKYGKISKNKNQSLITYSNLIEEVNYIKSHTTDQDSVVDSLIYSIGEILYFDFNEIDSSSYNFKKIIFDYPNSKFRYKSLMFMDLFEPDTTWNTILVNDYPEYIKGGDHQGDHLSKERDEAWELLSSSKEEAIKNFLNIYIKKNDSKSLYSIAFIYDNYLNNIEKAVEYYKMYISVYSNEEEYYDKCLNKLRAYDNRMTAEIKDLKNKVNYTYGYRWIKNYQNIDSSLYYLDLVSGNEYKQKSRKLAKQIEEYEQNILLYEKYLSKDSMEINIDSILYNIAEFKNNKLELDSLAKEDYISIISNEFYSDFDLISYATLNVMEPEGKWDSLLKSNVEDTMQYNILIKNETDQKIKEIPSIYLKNLNGVNVDVLKIINDGPAIICFWGFSCKSCLNDLLPLLDEYNENYSDKNFKVISVNLDKRKSKEVKSYLEENNFSFKTLNDSHSLFFKKLGGKKKDYGFLVFVNGQNSDRKNAKIVSEMIYNADENVIAKEKIEAHINYELNPGELEVNNNRFNAQHEAFKASVKDKFSDIELLYSIEEDSVYLSWLEKRSETLNINISDLVDGNLQDQLKDTSNKKNTYIDNNNSIIDKSLFENLKNTIDTSKINFNMNKGILPNGMILDSSKIKIQKGE